MARVQAELATLPVSERSVAALRLAQQMADEDAAACSAIGDHGLPLLEKAWEEQRRQHP